MKEEIIIINNEPFYKIPNGTSCDYAPIPKQFKPYFEKLEEENKSLQSQLKAKEEVIKEAREYVEKYDVFKEFYFPLMKRDVENQIKSSIKYEFDTSIKKNLLKILSKGENK